MQKGHTTQEWITFLNQEIKTCAIQIGNHPSDAITAKRMITMIERVERLTTNRPNFDESRPAS